MIISRTPYRISYFGGGCDFAEYYTKHKSIIFSTAINKYMYITVNKKFDGKVHVRYSQIEEKNTWLEINHTIIRECLKFLDIKRGIEIVTISDVPSKGTGLGSSSALTVGLLKALYQYIGVSKTNKELAEEACHIEIDILCSPIGKQDQYACALGGFNKLIFNTDSSIEICSYDINRKRIQSLKQQSLLFFTTCRDTNIVLKEYKNNIQNKFEYLHKTQEVATFFERYLNVTSCANKFPSILLKDAWEQKKASSFLCSNSKVDTYINKVHKISPYIGAKLCGAGNGGFLLVISPVEYHDQIRYLLRDLHEEHFQFESEGSTILYDK